MTVLMTATDFINRLKDIANNKKTIYILGCFGAPMVPKNKTRYSKNNDFNAGRAGLINACSSDTFGFDCVGLIKAILWGWRGDVTATYGGATYKANGVPDIGANSMMNTYCKDVSKDFSNIIPGEAVWMDGHIGIYIGDGLVVEATSKWAGKVLISALGNIGAKGTYVRTWTKHGKLPWISYAENMVSQPKPVEPVTKPVTKPVSTPSTNTENTNSVTVSLSKVDSAKSFDKTIAGDYKSSADINLRSGAGLSKSKIALIPKGNIVKCYGYYTKVLGVKWYLVQTTIKGVQYTGFCHGGYLKR